MRKTSSSEPRVLVIRIDLDNFPDVMFRDSAQPLRERLLAEWNDWDRFVLDFDNRIIASASFLDEIAKVALTRSRDEIVAKIELRNISVPDRRLLNECLQKQLAEGQRERRERRATS